jgi:hypothetical protein
VDQSKEEVPFFPEDKFQVLDVERVYLFLVLGYLKGHVVLTQK